MGLITGILTLPLAPVRGVTWLAEQIYTEADRQWRDPERIRRELQEAERARDAGEISDRECNEIQDSLLSRLSYGRSYGTG